MRWASPRAPPRRKFWSTTSSRPCADWGRWRSRSCRGGRKRSSSGCRRNWPRHPDVFILTFHIGRGARPARELQLMGIPFLKEMRIGAYLLKQKLLGRERYPLVLMLEPLFRCNLACFGCGKIDYPDPILNRRLSVQECLDAVDECGAPMVAIPGGEPLIHKEIGEIVAGIVARRKYVILCTNALLLEKKLHLFTPSPYLTFSIHLDGDRAHHDKSVSKKGFFEIAVPAIGAAQAKGLKVNVNAPVFDGHAAEDIA